MRKYIIFDFDGTLIDTTEIVIKSWQATYMKFYGRTISEDEIVKTMGETLVHTVKRDFPNNNTEEVVEYYRNWQFDHYDESVKLFPGVEQMLDELSRTGHRLFLVTSRTKEGTEKYLADYNIKKYFTAVVTPAECKEKKPSPEPLWKALETVEEENPQPEECIMIGDTKFDIGCANNAGIDAALVMWGHPVNLRLLEASEYKEQFRVKNIQELMELVR